jgi:hypothetical protein
MELYNNRCDWISLGTSKRQTTGLELWIAETDERPLIQNNFKILLPASLTERLAMVVLRIPFSVCSKERTKWILSRLIQGENGYVKRFPFVG